MSDLGSAIAYVTYDPGGPFMRSLAAGFAAIGVEPATLIAVSPRERLAAEWRRRRFAMVPPVARAATRRPAFARADVRVKRLNSEELVAVIRERGIRYLVNGGAGIFREPLLSAPGLVIVNAHAGALPAFRNVNVVEWALYTGAPVVGTVHRVDAGIDTGPVLLERTLDLASARSVEQARAMAFDQVARLAAPAVAGHARGELHERPQPREGTRWYAMHPRLRARLDRRLAATGP